MSWLSERTQQRRARPYRVADLAEAIGLNPGDPKLTSQLVRRLGMSRGWVLRCRTLGLTEAQADEWAIRAGIHPGDVWDRWYDGLKGVALVNANRKTCPDGHPYDRVDSNGFRRCSACWRAQWRRYKKSRKPLVTGLLDAPPNERAPLVLCSDPMEPATRAPRERVVAAVPVDIAQRINALAHEAGISVSAWACMHLTAAVRATGNQTEEDVA